MTRLARMLFATTLALLPMVGAACETESPALPSVVAPPATPTFPPIPDGDILVDTTRDNRWLPEQVTIRAGESITFRWLGPIPHNVRIDGLINTPVTATGQYRVTFETPGTYSFICDVHLATMIGTVTVE